MYDVDYNSGEDGKPTSPELLAMRPGRTCVAKTAIVMDFVKRMRAGGATVTVDKEAGTVVAMDGDTMIYRALQWGNGGAWLVWTKNSDRFQWS